MRYASAMNAAYKGDVSFAPHVCRLRGLRVGERDGDLIGWIIGPQCSVAPTDGALAFRERLAWLWEFDTYCSTVAASFDGVQHCSRYRTEADS